MATLPVQPGTSAVENTTSTFSAILGPSMEEQVQLQVAQQMKSSHLSFVAITDDEMDGEEE